MRRSNREPDSTTSPVCDPLWPGAGTWAKVIPSQYLSETLRAVRSSRAKLQLGPGEPGKAEQLRAPPSPRFAEATRSARGASPAPGHAPNERRAPGRSRPTCPRQAPARGPSFVRSGPRCRSPRAPFPPPGHTAPSAGAGPTPELTCRGCGVGSSAGPDSLCSARGPLAQPPRTPHRRPEPARPECRICPEGRRLRGLGSGETRRPYRPFRRRCGRRRPRPGSRDPGKFRPRLSGAVGGHGSSAAPARGARSRGSAACAPPRPAPPPRPPQPAAARDAPLRRAPPRRRTGSRTCLPRPSAPTVPQALRGQCTATARGRGARTRDLPVPFGVRSCEVTRELFPLCKPRTGPTQAGRRLGL